MAEGQPLLQNQEPEPQPEPEPAEWVCMIADPKEIGVIVKRDGPKRRRVDFTASGGKLVWRDAVQLQKAVSPEEQAAAKHTGPPPKKPG